MRLALPEPVFQHGGPFWAAAGGRVPAKRSSVTKVRRQVVEVWEADVGGVCRAEYRKGGSRGRDPGICLGVPLVLSLNTKP